METVKQSVQLTQFYRDVLAWVDAGYPEAKVFGKHRGLCSTMFYYFDGFNSNTLVMYKKADEEMKQQFCDAGLNPHFPFNNDSECFVAESWDSTTYDNPKRIAWLREHVNM